MTDTTEHQAVTVAQETMTRPGYVVWHSSEEDGGPDVGITVGLGDDKMLWIGERSGREGDGMGLMVYSDKAIDANASVGEYDEIRDLIEHHVAPALSRLASVSSASAETIQTRHAADCALLYDDGPDECTCGVVTWREAVARIIDPYVWEEGDDTHGAFMARSIAYEKADEIIAASPEPVPAANQAGEVERLRAALERIRDTPDNLVPSVTIQGMRNIAGFALLGEVLS